MITRKKSWFSRANDLLTEYLRLRTASKAAKGAGKAVKWTAAAEAGKAVAERTPKKGWPALAGGVGVATAALAAPKWRGASSGEPHSA